MEKSEQLKETAEKNNDNKADKERSKEQNEKAEEKKENASFKDDSSETDHTENKNEENMKTGETCRSESDLMRTSPVITKSLKKQPSSSNESRDPGAPEIQTHEDNKASSSTKEKTTTEKEHQPPNEGLSKGVAGLQTQFDTKSDLSTKEKSNTEEEHPALEGSPGAETPRLHVLTDTKPHTLIQEKTTAEERNLASKGSHGTEAPRLQKHIDTKQHPSIKEKTTIDEERPASKEGHSKGVAESHTQFDTKSDLSTKETTATEEEHSALEGSPGAETPRLHVLTDTKPHTLIQEKTTAKEENLASKGSHGTEAPRLQKHIDTKQHPSIKEKTTIDEEHPASKERHSKGVAGLQIQFDNKTDLLTKGKTAAAEEHLVSEGSRGTETHREQIPRLLTQENTRTEGSASLGRNSTVEPRIQKHIETKPYPLTQEKTTAEEHSTSREGIEPVGLHALSDTKGDSSIQERATARDKKNLKGTREKAKGKKAEELVFHKVTSTPVDKEQDSKEMMFKYWCWSKDIKVTLCIKKSVNGIYQEFVMHKKPPYFYEIRICELGQPPQGTKIKYYFKETTWRTWQTKTKKMEVQVKEKFRHMSSHCKEGVTAHLEDIVISSSSVQDVISEYQQFMPLISDLSENDGNWILKELFKRIMSKYLTGPADKLLQLAYLQACVIRDNKKSFLFIEDLSREKIQQFLTIVGETYIKRRQLSDETELFLSIVFNRLCTHIINLKPPGWSDVNVCFHFLKTNFLSAFLHDESKRKMTTTDTDTLSREEEDSAVGILITLCQKASVHWEESENYDVIIGKLFKTLPFNNAVRTFSANEYTGRSAEFSEKVQDCVKRCFIERIKFRLFIVNKKRSWKLFMECYESVEDKIDTLTLKRIFEDSCIDLLQNAIDPENARCVVDKYIRTSHLFTDKAAQTRLLESISACKNEKINQLFLLCGKLKVLKKAFIDLDISCFKTWYYSSQKTEKSLEKHDISDVCTKITSILKLELSERREEILKLVSVLLRDEFEKFKLEELLDISTKIASISEDDEVICKEFRMIFSSQLKNESQNPKELLELLIKSRTENDTFLIDSRLQADLTCMVIDECFLINPATEFHEQMKRIVEYSSFWNALFNARGKSTELVHSNKTYIVVQECVFNMRKHIQSQKVGYCLAQTFPVNECITDNLYTLLDERGNEKYKQAWIHISQILATERENIECVRNVLTEANSRSLPHSLLLLTEYIESMKSKFEAGRVLATTEDLKMLWDRFDDLPRICRLLEHLISSDAFWGICIQQMSSKTLIGKTENKTFSKEDTKSSLTCGSKVKTLFQTSPHMKLFEKINEDIAYLAHLERVCVEDYKQFWTHFSEDINLHEVMTILKPSSDLQKERTILGQTFGIWLADETDWITLEKIFTIDKVKRQVEALKDVLNAFDIVWENDESFAEAILLFRDLLETRVSDRTLKEVKHSCQPIFDLTQHMSEDMEAVLISLKESKPLVLFLKQTVNEDIRNLLDAVEDIFEQFVSETTVSALIDTKKFLHPMLRTENVSDCTAFLTMIESQIKAHESSSTLGVNITDCIRNLHNLISLYKNVANREEQTKEIVKNIIEKGTFRFKMNAHDECVLINVLYTNNGTDIVKSEMTLIDLRSRVLLLKTNDTTTDWNNFISIIDDCFNLSKILVQLHVSGHFQYESFDLELGSKMLRQEAFALKPKLDTWQNDLKEARQMYYLMTYVHGSSLQILHTYLNNKSENSDAVQTMLLFIHPKMQAEVVRTLYTKASKGFAEVCDRNILLCMGNAIHTAFSDQTSHMRELELEKDGRSLRFTDKVHEGKILVAHLEEGSLYTVKTVLALYANTTGCLPEANQILFCTQETSIEELELLILRCVGADMFHERKVLFCIANVEMLSNEIQFTLTEKLNSLRLQKNNSKFLLAVVCRGSRSNPFIHEFSDVVVTVNPASDSLVKSIFKTECPNVFTLTSDFAGLGKTQRIHKVSHKENMHVVALHISGLLRRVNLVQRLAHLRFNSRSVLHIDIGHIDDPSALDTFLFELIILRFVSVGRMTVCLNTRHVVLEVANTMQNTLRDSLHTTMLFRNENITWDTIRFDFVVSMEINSPEQTVCRYLQCLEDKTLDQTDLLVSQEHISPISAFSCRKLLKQYFGRMEEMTFPILKIAINVLSDQLKKLTYSPFFRIARLQDMVGKKEKLQTKSTLVKEMVNMSIEFASRSVKAYRQTQYHTVEKDEMPVDNLVHSNQTSGMVRWEDTNHLIFVFHTQNIQAISALYRDNKQVPRHIKQLFESQMRSKMDDFSKLEQSALQNLLQKMTRHDPLPLPKRELENLANEYALTTDNLLKMVLIILRIKANIPVIIIGDTGCGKTSLVRYLAAVCGVDFEVLSIHSGMSEGIIIDTVKLNNKEAIQAMQRDRWLFLDEINTSESIGLISEILCHHTCLGQRLAPNLTILGACNPYKLRTESQLLIAGLTEKSKSDKFSKLVYRVLPLPERMVDYVWDFGSIGEKDERKYIYRMIDGLFKDKHHHELLTHLLSDSQAFVRQHESSACAVSLRDIQRVKLLTSWFLEKLEMKVPKQKSIIAIDCKVRAIILALAHCYHCRFQDKSVRKEYRTRLKQIFAINGDAIFKRTDDVIFEIIKEEQLDFMLRMELPEGTACNSALIENVFVIIVSIFTRIPVFVVGKPGCSKSLAMQVIRSNLRGKDSTDEFFKTLPQLYCVSFQGSESSTSDGIKKVFEKAEKHQERNQKDDVLSVVILDEIGLAEVSRFNPLKVLHDLLEPNEDNVEHVRRNLTSSEKSAHGGKGYNLLARPNIAVVGMSNWALDASKMNRAIYLSRTDMDEEELFETAKSITCEFLETESKHNYGKTPFEADVQKLKVPKCIYLSDILKELKHVAEAYNMYTHQLFFKNFHGLRDFYALVKYIARKFSSQTTVEQTVRYYFEASDVTDKQRNACVVFAGLGRNFGGLRTERKTLLDCFSKYFSFPSSVEKSTISLIHENVEDPLARHLMLITSGDSAVGILEQKLNEIYRYRKEIIFGSQFEEDLTEDYHYRILNRIILCMEQGVVLILKDLESVYGSLYDMLNQNYTVIGNKQNCRIALGAYSNPICQVAKSFRCIVLIDETKIQACDPPFLNRFEKQYLRFSDVLNEEQKGIIEEIEFWIKGLVEIKSRTFRKIDIFPNYSYDLLASLILTLYSRGVQKSDDHENILSMCKKELLWIIKPEAVIRLAKATRADIKSEADILKRQYLSLPLHTGLKTLVKYQLKSQSSGILTIVFTNSNIYSKIHTFSPRNIEFQTEKLGTFKSEKQLSQRIEHFWFESKALLLVVQCSAVEDENHILLTKTLIEKNRNIYKANHSGPWKHVYLIVHLDKSKGISTILPQINYTVSEWKLVMMDTLDSPKIHLEEYLQLNVLEAVKKSGPLETCITEQLFWAVTRIKYGPFGRSVPDIEEMIDQIKKSEDLLSILHEMIWDIICKMDIPGKEWYLNVACDIQKLNISSSFVDALDQYILGLIRQPLAKILFYLEREGLLDSYFVNDNNFIQRTSWKRCVKDSNIFTLNDIPDQSGPECYVCETANLKLRMPFSMLIYKELELKKDEYLNDILLLKVRFDCEKGQKIYDQVCEELSTQLVEFFQRNVPKLSNLFYSGWEEAYINDFCSILSLSLNPTITHEKRTRFMQWVISQKIKFKSETGFDLLVRLHTTSWLNATLFRAEMQLLGMCENVMMGKDLVTELGKIHTAYTEFGKTCENQNPEQDVKETATKSGEAVLYTTTNITQLSRGEDIESGEELLKEVDASKVDMSSDIEVIAPNDFLVDCICKSMLPTAEVLSLYEGIDDWQQKINYLLATASKVSVDAAFMQSLRVCSEVVNDLLLQFAMAKDLVEPFARLLLEQKELHSEPVFHAILNIIKCCTNTHDCHEDVILACYSVFSSYLTRCISLTEECRIPILNLLYVEIGKHCIPDIAIRLLKPPLLLTLKLEDLDVLASLLEVDDNLAVEINESNKIQSDYSEDNWRRSDILTSIDVFLKTLYQQSEVDCPFVLLLVDVLQEMYADVVMSDLRNAKFEVPETFYICCKSIKDYDFGVQFISALAYIKALFALMSSNRKDMLSGGCTSAIELPLYINVKEGHVSSSLQMLYLKTLAKRSLVCRIQSKFDDNDSIYNNNWKKGYKSGFTRSPLCLCIAEETHRRFCTYGNAVEINQNLMKELVRSSKEDYQCVLLVLSLAAKTVYLAQSCGNILLSSKTLTGFILNEIEEQNCVYKYFFQILIGEKDFKTPYLHIGQQTETDKYYLVTFLLSTYTMLIAHTSVSEMGCMSFLSKCLISPQTLSWCTLPVFFDSEFDHSDTTETYITRSSKCGYHYVLYSQQPPSQCPFCANKFEMNHLVHDIQCDRRLVRYFQESVRRQHPFMSDFLKLIVKGCMFGALALDNASIETINEKLQSSACSQENFWIDIEMHWSNLCKHLNVHSSNLWLILHSIIQLTEKDLCSIPTDLETTSEIRQWEEQLQGVIVPAIQSRFKHVQKTMRQHDAKHGVHERTTEQQLFEVDELPVDDKERTASLPLLFRIKAIPTKDNFCFEYYGKQKKFPFIDLVLKYEESLQLTIYIYDIVRWNIAAVANANYILMKHECLEMTVNDFIHRKSDSMATNAIKSRFDTFQEAWDVLIKRLQPVSNIPKLNRIHMSTKMADCMIYDKETDLFKILHMLVSIQNEFINETLKLAKETGALKFLVGNKMSSLQCVEISHVQRADLIDSNVLNWKDLLDRLSQCELEYGSGEQITYDFQSIEKALVVKLISGKSFINFQNALQKPIFKDSLYVSYASLLDDLTQSIPQEKATVEIEEGINKTAKKASENATILLTHLGIVMTLMKKTSGNPKTSLVDYITKWKNIIPRDFPLDLLPYPQNSVKLCHVVSVSEILEELCSQSVIDGLDYEYKESLDKGSQMEISQKARNVSFSHVMLKAMKRFAYRCLSNKSASPLASLRQYLNDESFWPDGCLKNKTVYAGGKEENIEFLLPDFIMVRHIHDVIQLIRKAIASHDESAKRMDALYASSFQQSSSTEKRRTTKSKRKALVVEFTEY